MENAGIVIAGIIYLIPLATLIWKAATLSNKVAKHEEDIKEMKGNQKEQTDKILSALEKLNDTMLVIQADVTTLKVWREAEKVLKKDENN